MKTWCNLTWNEFYSNTNANQHYFRNCSSQVGVAVDDMRSFELSDINLVGKWYAFCWSHGNAFVENMFILKLRSFLRKQNI